MQRERAYVHDVPAGEGCQPNVSANNPSPINSPNLQRMYDTYLPLRTIFYRARQLTFYQTAFVFTHASSSPTSSFLPSCPSKLQYGMPNME